MEDIIDNIEENSLVKSNDLIKDTVNEEYEKQLQEFKKSDDFHKRIEEVVGIKSSVVLRADLLKALSEEQKNELLQYQIECEKEKLAYRKEKEKKVVLEEVKAEIQEKKINALKKRYAYLYELDENGQPKKFIASKFVNKYKEFCNWYDGTSDGFKKIIKYTFRIVFYVVLAYLGYKGLIWLLNNLPYLMGNNG